MQALVDPSRYTLSAYALPALLFGLLNACAGLVTLRRERASGVAVAFCGMTLVVALWLIGFAFVYCAGDADLALIWIRVAHLGVCFIPASVFLFSAAVTGRLSSSRWMIRAGFALAAFIYTLDVSTDWLISGVDRYWFGYYPIFSPGLSPLLFGYFALYLGASLHLYRITLRTTRSVALQRRLRALLIAIAIAELAVVDFLADFHLPVYPFGFAFIGAYVVIGSWAIARYRLVDITPALAAEQILDVMAEGLLVVDRDGIIRVANAAAEAGSGISGSAVGLSIDALDAAWSQPALTRLIDPSKEHQSEIVYRARDGSARTVLLASSRLEDHRGTWVGTVYIIRDITARWQAERAVRESEERFRSLVQNASDLITVIDPDTTILYQSPAIEHVLGFEVAAIIGTRLSETIHRDDVDRFLAVISELLSQPGHPVTGEGRVRNAAGEWRHLEFVGSDQRDNASIGGLVLNVRDVTDRLRLEDELRLQALYDPLTGLANRYQFTDHLERALARHARTGSGVAVLFLDLDDFKTTNDHHGHAAGDRLLHEVGQRLKATVRDMDVVARLGGDEFAIVLESVASTDEAAATAARILDVLDQPLVIDGSEMSVTASIGISLPGHDSSADRALRNADIAMYAAKSRGRGRFEIYEERPQAFSSSGRQVVDERALASVDNADDWTRRDGLTGAWNHAAIIELVQRELERRPVREGAVAVVDINGMTEINATFGHDSGDHVLRAVARVLARGDVMVGRFGGDRFLVLLPDTHRVGAKAYVADVSAAIGGLAMKDSETNSTIAVSITTGAAVYPDDAGLLDELIRLGEGAMFVAKARRASQASETARRLAERVGNLTDDLVPLLTSPAPLDQKIQLVAKRLSDGFGYDAAQCMLYRVADQQLSTSVAVIDGEVSPMVRRWLDVQDGDPMRDQTDIRALLAKTGRPIIIDDMVSDERISEAKRSSLLELGLHSALIVPMTSNGELIGELSIARRATGGFGPADARFLSAVAHQVGAMVRMATLVEHLQRASERLEGAQAETVFMLAAAAEAHDRTTGEHLRHIRVLSEALARELGYDDAAVRELGLAATLHDIGKISVPDSVLSSPLRFDTDDFEIARMWETLKRHSVWGGEFLTGREGFVLAAKVARWHHERWDGSGYPDGLAGDRIPEEVTIVTVADAFDAMVSDRPYRSGRAPAAAVAEIVSCSGKQFNPRVVDALVRLHIARQLPTAREDELAA